LYHQRLLAKRQLLPSKTSSLRSILGILAVLILLEHPGTLVGQWSVSPPIQDQVQDSPLSVLRCHEACKTWRTCTKCDYMIWQWGIASKWSPPPLKFNWIGLPPIQLNLFPNTHIKYSHNVCEITKLPLIQKLVQVP